MPLVREFISSKHHLDAERWHLFVVLFIKDNIVNSQYIFVITFRRATDCLHVKKKLIYLSNMLILVVMTHEYWVDFENYVKLVGHTLVA